MKRGLRNMKPRKLKYGEKQLIKAYYKFDELMNDPLYNRCPRETMKMLELSPSKILYAKGIIDNIKEKTNGS